MGGDTEPQHPQCGAEEEGEEPLVQEGATVAHRMRGSHQRAQAAARIESLPLSRRRRDETLGGVGRDGGYVNQHRQCSGSAGVETVAPGAPLVAGARAKAPPTLSTYSPGTSGTDSEMPILRRKVIRDTRPAGNSGFEPFHCPSECPNSELGPASLFLISDGCSWQYVWSYGRE